MLLEQTGIAAAGCYSWSKQGLVLLEQTGIGAAGCYSWSKHGLVLLEQTGIGAAKANSDWCCWSKHGLVLLVVYFHLSLGRNRLGIYIHVQ